jgi:hypothetical protein
MTKGKILHNEEVQNLFASPNINKVITLQRMRGAVHILCMEEMRN